MTVIGFLCLDYIYNNCTSAAIGCVDCKKLLADGISNYFEKRNGKLLSLDRSSGVMEESSIHLRR